MSKLITRLFYGTKYVVIFLRNHNGNLFVVGKKVYKQIKYLKKATNNKHFIIDIQNPCYIRDNFRVFYVDSETGSQYHFSETKLSISPDEIDAVVGNKIIRELVSGVLDNKKMKIMYFVMGAIMGILLGLVIMQFVMQNKVEEILTDKPNYPVPF